MFYVKTYEIKGEFMVAVCDKDILGKTFSEGTKKITVSEKFYKGEDVDPDTLRNLLKKSTIANLIGERCVFLAEEMGLVENKITIQGIPHVQIFEIK